MDTVRVSLDPYRTPGVLCFSGDARGELVAQAVLEEHGTRVVIEIPEDVYSVDFNFWRGFLGVFTPIEVHGSAVLVRGYEEARELYCKPLNPGLL